MLRVRPLSAKLFLLPRVNWFSSWSIRWRTFLFLLHMRLFMPHMWLPPFAEGAAAGCLGHCPIADELVRHLHGALTLCPKGAAAYLWLGFAARFPPPFSLVFLRFRNLPLSLGWIVPGILVQQEPKRTDYSLDSRPTLPP